jgi:hypothetical protein
MKNEPFSQKWLEEIPMQPWVKDTDIGCWCVVKDEQGTIHLIDEGMSISIYSGELYDQGCGCCSSNQGKAVAWGRLKDHPDFQKSM